MNVNTSLCYIERDGRYLMLHRVKKEHDLNRDKWIGVGGGFQENESPEDCCCREAFEETGLTLHGPLLRAVVTFVMEGDDVFDILQGRYASHRTSPEFQYVHNFL